jgi:hypothetical protein
LSQLTRAIRFVRHWHARIGILVAVFLLFLAVTGLALSHTDALGLNKQQITAGWLMRWYGLKPSVPDQGFLFKGGYLVASDGHWVMDGKLLTEPAQMPVGAISWGKMRALANTETLYLYLADGRLVDKLSGAALPASPIQNIANVEAKLAIKTSKGDYVTDDGLNWQPLTGAEPAWSSVQSLPDSASANLSQVFAPSLSLERIVLDLHSGRIFGRYGPLFMDITALVLIVLAFSGVWIYLRSFRKRSK